MTYLWIHFLVTYDHKSNLIILPVAIRSVERSLDQPERFPSGWHRLLVRSGNVIKASRCSLRHGKDERLWNVDDRHLVDAPTV